MAVGDLALVEDAKTDLVTGTASLAQNAFSSQAEAVALLGNTRPDANVVFVGTFALAPAAGEALYVFRRDLDIDGASDAPIPDANYEHILVAIIPVDPGSASQVLPYPEMPLSKNQELYIKNGSAQTLNSGYRLAVGPTTVRTE